MEKQKLELIAKNVFNCINQKLHTIAISLHERFPHGCCDIASSLLYSILEQEGYKNSKLIRGENAKNEYHVWVEVDQYVIDLTAHQFGKFNSPYILTLKNNYPLNKKPFFSVTHVYNNDNWPYFEALYPYFHEIYYNHYHK